MDKAVAASQVRALDDSAIAPERLTRALPRRISIVGTSGAGKSYLARKLAAELDLPLFELDRLRNGPDGAPLGEQQFAAIVAEIASKDDWIIDGHYRSVRHLIWQRSTTIVWLDYPFRLVFSRVLGRYFEKRRKAKPRASSPSTSEAVEFASWTSRAGRLFRALNEPREYARLLDAAEQDGKHIIRVQSPHQAERLPPALAKLLDDTIAPIGRWSYGSQRMIEMLGVPGSGKSTIGDVLVTEIGARNRWAIVSDWRKRALLLKAWYVARGLVDVPRLLAATRFAWATRISSPTALGRLIRLIAKYHWIDSRPGTLLLHQGYLQDVWSMLAFSDVRQINPDCVARFLSALYRGTNHTFVYFDLDPDTATRRIASRTNGTSRLDRMSESEIRQRLVERVWVAELIYSAAIAAGLTIIKIDASRSIEEVHAETLRVLNARGFLQVTAES